MRLFYYSKYNFLFSYIKKILISIIKNTKDQLCMSPSLSSVDGIPVAVDVEGVVVELGVALQPDPLVPPGGNVFAHVLVQVLAEITLK